MKRRIPKLQTLERRTLLAADAGVIVSPVIVSEHNAVDMTSSSLLAEQGTSTRDEAANLAPDLVQFARKLADSGTIFYGSNWDPASTQQKQLFHDGGDDLPFIEVTNPDRTASQFAIDNNITAYPTWEFPDGSANGNRVEGVLSLEQLSTLSGIPIPESEDPTFTPIGNQTALIGSPLHIPIDGYDPDSNSLTVTVSVDNPNLLEAEVLSGNRSIRIDMQGYGDMVFELYEQRAPRASGRVIELAEADFYDDIVFHRVIDNFVIQGGDPTGTGTSGSTLPDFDDDFHPDLQHNSGGILSFAKSSDDTNNSQFFVTETPTRHLDFNHSIFGQLVEGEDVREAISNHAVNGASKPTTDIVIDTIDVFTDLENSVVMLKPTGNGTGSTNVTFTITDGDGNSHSETVQVDVLADTSNGQPYLNDITVPDRFDPNTPAKLQLSSTDVEGDPVTYAATTSSSDATVVVDQNGLVTVTPQTGFTGEVRVNASVSPGPGVTGNSASDRDNQTLTFHFGEAVIPSSIVLLASSDSGMSATDNVTRLQTPTFLVSGATAGATIELVVEGQVVGSALALGSDVAITTTLPANELPTGEALTVTAMQHFAGSTISLGSRSITLDTTPPSLSRNQLATISPGSRNTIDLASNEAYPFGVSFELVRGPSGSTIDADTGSIQWDAPANLETDPVFIVALMDRAGNTSVESFVVPVETISLDPIVGIRLGVVDLAGQPIDSVQVGQSFRLQLMGVDERSPLDRKGVFAIFADVEFDPSLALPQGEISHDFGLTPNGTFGDGVIDEWGAATKETMASLETSSLISEATFVATATGSLTFTSNPAEGQGLEILLFGINDVIPAGRVEFGEATLEIIAAPDVEPEDVDQNGTVTPQDALMIINALSSLRDGTAQVIDLQSSLAHRYDTNRDGWITSQDALIVINHLDRMPSSPGNVAVIQTAPSIDNLTALSISEREDAVDQLLTAEDPMLF